MVRVQNKVSPVREKGRRASTSWANAFMSPAERTKENSKIKKSESDRKEGVEEVKRTGRENERSEISLSY